MKAWKLCNYKKLKNGNLDNIDSGYIPRRAKYQKSFVNIFSGELIETTDLKIARNKRNKIASEFCKRYEKSYKDGNITILSLVVNQNRYGTISKFLNSFNRKLKRKGIVKVDHIWIRDCGEKRAQKHFHILIVTSLICNDMFHSLFSKKKHDHYAVQIVRRLKGITRYFIAKGLYGGKNQRTFGNALNKIALFNVPNFKLGNPN